MCVIGSIVGHLTTIPWWFWCSMACGTAWMVLTTTKQDLQIWPLLGTSMMCAMIGYSQWISTAQQSTHLKNIITNTYIGPIHIQGVVRYQSAIGDIVVSVKRIYSQERSTKRWIATHGYARVDPGVYEHTMVAGTHTKAVGRGKICSVRGRPELCIELMHQGAIQVDNPTQFITRIWRHIQNGVRLSFR